MTQAILGLGSNIGDKKQNIFIASDLISKLGTNFKISPLYETFPHGFEIQPNFVNAVCVLEVNFSPWEFFDCTSSIEKKLGKNKSFLNAPRAIDIDVLMWGNHVFNTPNLILPHPRISDREFVLRPLIDLLPELIHPVTKKTIYEMYNDIKSVNGSMRRI